MPRLKQVPRSEADPSVIPFTMPCLARDRDPVTEPGTATGTPGNWWTVFAQVPDCLQHMVAGFQFYRDRKRKISPRLREPGQARAGTPGRSQFRFAALQSFARR